MIAENQPSKMARATNTKSSSANSIDLENGNICIESQVAPFTPWTPSRREYLIMATLAMVSFIVALDATILVPVLPDLALSLHGTSTEAFWAGGGGIVSLTSIIFCDIVPLRQRPKYFAAVLASWAIGTVTGPVVGGACIDNINWRWAFYINLPFCAIGLVMVPLCVKLKAVQQRSVLEKIKGVDWIGGVLFIGSMTVLLMGLSWAGIQYSWRSLQTLVPIFVGVAGLVVLSGWERWAKLPFLRASLFYNVSAIMAFYCALISGFIMFTALYYGPFYFLSVRGTSPTHAGANIIAVTSILVPGSIIVSILTTRLGRFRWAIWGGWAIVLLACGLLSRLDKDTPTYEWVLYFAIFGLGNGMCLTSVNFGIQAISSVENAGAAASTIFQNAMTSKLLSLHLSPSIAKESEAFVAVLKTLKQDNPTRTGAIEAYVHGFRWVFLTMAIAAASALVASAFIKKFSMDKRLLSMYTAREVVRDHEMAVENREMVAGDHEMLVENHEIVAGNHEKMTENHEMVVANHEKMTENHEMVVANHEKMTENHEIVAGNHEKVAGNHEEIAGNHEKVTGDHEKIPEIHEKTAERHENVEGEEKIPEIHEEPAGNHEKIPEIHEKPAETPGKIPEIHDKTAENHEKIPEIHEKTAENHESVEGEEKIPECHEKAAENHEKLPEIHEKLPETHEKPAETHDNEEREEKIPENHEKATETHENTEQEAAAEDSQRSTTS
ncbi:hypothetical protein EG327_005973 [Venturia inaequalis]|uniref:Major facilitator superfamily (MFS) profile domain-containing protein n=1 Tax=Venturia inaequalis TaxID=5025 RepID=A0A8H3V6H9_VENIN|nr:hypothetical protein EG327_005973 [Venturia inaequalis]